MRQLSASAEIARENWTMDQLVKGRWVAALRSGEYKQGRMRLTKALEDGTEVDCCLGVLCKVLEIPRTTTKLDPLGLEGFAYGAIKELTLLPLPVVDIAGLQRSNPRLPFQTKDSTGYIGTGLASLNDAGITFDQIADLIEYFL